MCLKSSYSQARHEVFATNHDEGCGNWSALVMTWDIANMQSVIGLQGPLLWDWSIKFLPKRIRITNKAAELLLGIMRMDSNDHGSCGEIFRISSSGSNSYLWTSTLGCTERIASLSLDTSCDMLRGRDANCKP